MRCIYYDITNTLHTHPLNNDEVTKEQCGSTTKTTAFASTIVQPWNTGEHQSTSEREEHAGLKQLLDEKDAQIESLKQQLYEKEKLISEVEETVKALKQQLMKVRVPGAGGISHFRYN